MTVEDDMDRVIKRMRSGRYPTPATCGHSPDGVSTCVDHDCPCAKGQWERDKEKPDEPIAHPVISFQQGSGGATQPEGEGSAEVGDLVSKEAEAAVQRAIDRLRSMHDYAGRPAWDQVVADEMRIAIRAAQIQEGRDDG